MKYRSRRIVSDVVVRITLGDDEGYAIVRNATNSGLKIEGKLDAEEDDKIVLGIRDRTYRGRIVWVTETEAGIQFDSCLGPADLAFFTGQRQKGLTRARARVGFAM